MYIMWQRWKAKATPPDVYVQYVRVQARQSVLHNDALPTRKLWDLQTYSKSNPPTTVYLISAQESHSNEGEIGSNDFFPI